MEGRLLTTLAVFALGFFGAALAQYYEDDLLGQDLPEAVKRMYDTGPAKKPHPYVSQYKRLPLYNFGLGKRSSPYNFAPGQRPLEGDEDLADDFDDYPVLEEEEEEFAYPTVYGNDEMPAPEKRQNKYSFGLGKRLPKYDFGLGKRLPKYDFGLGKRLPKYDFGLGKRIPKYDFGLGKRSGQYSFGLGKKSAAAASLDNRYSFGLGKRSDETQANAESTDGSPEKREATPSDPEDGIRKSGSDGRARSALDKELDFGRPKSSASRQNLLRGYLGKPRASDSSPGKRIPRYDFGLGKRNYRMEN